MRRQPCIRCELPADEGLGIGTTRRAIRYSHREDRGIADSRRDRPSTFAAKSKSQLRPPCPPSGISGQAPRLCRHDRLPVRIPFRSRPHRPQSLISSLRVNRVAGVWGQFVRIGSLAHGDRHLSGVQPSRAHHLAFFSGKDPRNVSWRPLPALPNSSDFRL